MKILFIIFIGFFSFNAHSTTTISSVSNASNDVDLKTQTSIEIMAGNSGNSRCTTSDDVVNTCETATARNACNFRTVCGSTILRITVTSTASGSLNLTDSANNIIHVCNASYTGGQAETCEIPWKKICNTTPMGGSLTCDNFGSETFKLGVNNAGDNIPEDSVSISFKVVGMPVAAESIANPTDGGVDDYSLYPGDEKAFVTDFSAILDYSVTGAAEIVGLRGFYQETDCPAIATSVLPSSPNTFLLSLDTDTKEIKDNRMSGLENGATYLFMFGFEDKAGNIGLFKDLSAVCTHDQHSVMPRAVSGLLENNQNCFISTAAFGSPLNAKVKTFRKFRDVVLSQFSLGQKFIKFYYQYSPPIADKIRQSNTLRAITRAALWPAWAISAAVLYMGLMPFLFVVTMTLLSFVFLRNKESKKKLIIIFLILFGTQSSKAADDFFSTSETKTKAPPAETAPKEPPYSGNENDEFSEIEKSSQQSGAAEEKYEPEIEQPKRSTYDSAIKENPNKWKPFQRVPDEKRLEELSEKGLIKITKKGGYNYKVRPSEQNSAASFRFGMAGFPNLANPVSGTSFEDIYGSDKKPVLLVDYEWQFFKSFGKLGLKVGSGIMIASGHGQFDIAFDPPPAGGGDETTEAMEKYNFYMFPNSLSVIYRLDIFNKQWIVPFGEAGVDYMTFIEARDDGNDIKFGGSPHAHFAVGGSFLLDTLGKEMMADIDKQYGVNHMWLTAEYRRLQSLGGNFDFTDDIINAGLMVEF